MLDFQVQRLLHDLASPDPEVRDSGAFVTLAGRIGGGELDDSLEDIGDHCVTMLEHDAIQARTFGVLILAASVEQLGRLGRARSSATRWLQPFMTWYAEETDLRGYDESLGWLHAVAHGADALGCFAEWGDLNPDELEALLELVVTRAATETPHRWAEGEDDRLALATLIVLRQHDFGTTVVSDWVWRLSAVWSSPTDPPTPPAIDNAMRTARSLFIQLLLDPATDEESVQPPDRGALIETLGEAIRASLPASAPEDV